MNLKDLLSRECHPENRFISELNEVKRIVEQAKQAGYSVGIVGGVWDIVHIGHARYLDLAKRECDFLVTIVDSDELVKSRKGPTRPIVPEDERVRMVCHLASTDIVMLRTLSGHNSDKEYISSALRPDICILSTSTGDIPKSQQDIMLQFVKRIKVFEPQAETSTSARIRHLAIDSSKPLADAVEATVQRKLNEVTSVLSSITEDLNAVVKHHLDKAGSM